MALFQKTLVTIVSYNHGHLIEDALKKIPSEKQRDYDVLVSDDCSTDNSWNTIKKFPVNAIRHEPRKGLGGNIKQCIKYAIEHNYANFVILAGNNKDDINEVPRLIQKINEGYDYVQGSRFLPGGSFANLPKTRFFMVKAHALFFSIVCGFKFRFSDALNGFRAYRLSIFGDNRFNVWQNWLDNYEFEQYLQYYAVKLGYKIAEVPVSKTYPVNKNLKYSHVRPIIDWLHILKPVFYLVLGIKK